MTQKICIYTGARQYTETIFVDKWEIVQTKCSAFMNQIKLSMIEQMMKSLEDIL